MLDGRHILPVGVLEDPAHATHHLLLSSLPQEDIPVSEILAILATPEPLIEEQAPRPMRGAPSERKKDDPLLGPKLKLEWAKRHINELKATIGEFFESEPYELVHEVDSQTGENVYRLRVHKSVPVELSAILGDAVHNLRAALDQLVCTLIRLNSNFPKGMQGFPIATSGEDYESFVRKRIAGVSTKVERLIFRLKPYRGGNRRLWLLHQLDILDKHDGILPVSAAHAMTLIRYTMPGMFVGPDGTFRLGGGGRPFRTDWGIPDKAQTIMPLTDNVEFYRSPSGLQEEVRANISITFDQSEIAQGRPVVETLDDFAHFIEKLIGVVERKAL